MTRLEHAHALLIRTEQLWPRAHANLVALAGAYPTAPSNKPHHCPCHGECYCPCPRCACDTKLTTVEAAVHHGDQASRDLRTISATIGRCAAVCGAILDLTDLDSRAMHFIAQNATQRTRLHALVVLVDLARNVELAPSAQADAAMIHRYACTIHDTATPWAFTPTIGKAWQGDPKTTGDWCVNHLTVTTNGHPLLEPSSPQALEAGEALCHFCWTFKLGTRSRRHPAGRRPDARILLKRDRGEALTDKDVA